ncbi:MAG: hypothetical protein HQM16_18535 [Deltaproteobacteria bacterium]|nr:hypothetical protein [Deltaproteobacteria bacterium]
MRIVNKKIVVMFSLMVVLFGVAACGTANQGASGDSIFSSTTAVSFEGVIAGTNDVEGQTGALSVTVPATVAQISPFLFIRTAEAQSPVTVTGTLSPAGGGTVDLGGTYNPATGALDLTGDGGYTFTGTITDDGLMSGDYSGTDADTGGGFAGLDSTTNSVQVFCGTFEHGSDNSSGLFNLVVTDSVVSGVRVNYSSRVLYRTLSGTRTGNTIDAVVDDNGRRGHGLITGDTIAGTFENKQGNQGTFEGSVGACL